VPIIAVERVIYKANGGIGGINTSFSEMMALPNAWLHATFWFPWYNNVDLDTQLRFANVSNTTATVRVYIGGLEVTVTCFSYPLPHRIDVKNLRAILQRLYLNRSPLPEKPSLKIMLYLRSAA